MNYYTKNNVMMLNKIPAQFSGHVAELMNQFVYERINSDAGRNEVYREAEDAFLHKIDDESGIIGIWQGEFWGKWIISAAQVCDYSGNAELKDFIHNAALKLITYQDADGYLGTYRNSMMMFAPTLKKFSRSWAKTATGTGTSGVASILCGDCWRPGGFLRTIRF